MPDFANIRHVVLDLDGTVYLGKNAFPQTRPFLNSLDRLHIGRSFLTNNCSRSRADYARYLHGFGIEADVLSISTSAQATIHHLATELPTANRLHVLGTAGLCSDLNTAGFVITDDEPDAIVVGFDTSLTYEKLCQAAYWISRGLPYIATHPDRVCPTDRPTVLPDCGAICALLETATGRKPDAVPGKPNPAMLQAVFAMYDVAPHEVALVGDRLYTDIRMARDAGAVAVLTLTGETKRTDLDACPPGNRPDIVVAHLGELQLLIESSR